MKEKFCGPAKLNIAGTIWLLFFVLAGSKQLFADGAPRYDISAVLDAKNHYLEARQKTVFTNNSDKPVNEVYFHIYPHRRYSEKEKKFMYRYAGYFKADIFPEGFQSGDLRINSAKSRGKELVFAIEGQDQTILKVLLEQGLDPGESREIELDFSLEIPHCWNRLGWHKEIITLTRWYPILSVLDRSGWHNYPFYIYHQPFFSDSAYYKLSFTLPREQKLACGAALVSEKINPDGTKTLVLENEAPMRDLGLAISGGFQVLSRDLENIRIDVFYLPGNIDSARQAADHAAQAIRFYAARFGKYPYKQFTIATSYLGFGGDQSSGMIFIDTRMFRLPGFLYRYFDFLVSHETGHQWFYNLIGSDEYREMFLDEGVNSYWLLRHLEEKYGYNAQVMDLPGYLRWLLPNFSFRDSVASRYIYLAKNGYDRPVIGELSSFKEPSSIFALAYGKGAAILSMLESLTGKEVFDRIMSRYASEHRFKNARLEDLVRITREESAQDFDEFFRQWLNTDRKIDFAVKSVSAGKAVVENREDLRMPVKTRIIFKDGSQLLDLWNGKDKSREIVFPEGKAVKEVSVDPEKLVELDLDRVNNHWPRDFRLKPVAIYFFPWEMPLFQNRDAYNVVAGPSLGGSRLGLAGSAQEPYDQVLRLSSVYDFNGKAFDSRLGYELSHVAGQHNSLGFEVSEYQSSKRGHDLDSGKIYWRRELWPASYGIFDINDHATAYLIRDRKPGSSVSLNGRESITNLKYAGRGQSLLGLTGSISRCGPSFDPDYGWKFSPTQEFAGHFLGGGQSFWRSSLELSNYFPVLPRRGQKIASRIKFGWGGSADKNLFQLGGWEGLRGYGLKTIDGSRMALLSLEHRFPLASDLGLYFLDNIFCLNKIQGVVFFDAGKAWYSDPGSGDFKKNAGLGLRIHLGTLGILERVVLRMDVAQAINQPKEKAHLWFGINQSF